MRKPVDVSLLRHIESNEWREEIQTTLSKRN